MLFLTLNNQVQKHKLKTSSTVFFFTFIKDFKPVIQIEVNSKERVYCQFCQRYLSKLGTILCKGSSEHLPNYKNCCSTDLEEKYSKRSRLLQEKQMISHIVCLFHTKQMFASKVNEQCFRLYIVIKSLILITDIYNLVPPFKSIIIQCFN